MTSVELTNFTSEVQVVSKVQPEVTADTILSWLENDKGKQVFVFAKTWYTRLGSNSPHRKHPSLRAAVQFAMTDADMLKYAEAYKAGEDV